METGDLCADTAPMPKSKVCQDPGAVSDTCGVTTYQGTPYNNYMSYTGKMNLLQLHLLQKSKCTVSPAIKKNHTPYKQITRHIYIHVSAMRMVLK